jgi:membrane protease YdiL (CAAX protease family)
MGLGLRGCWKRRDCQGRFVRPSIVIAAIFCVLNPLFEELIVRGYLMTEIIELTGSTALAVFLSVVAQFFVPSLLRMGWRTVLVLYFLVSALYFAYRRRAFPIVIAHAFFGVYGMLRLLAR